MTQYAQVSRLSGMLAASIVSVGLLLICSQSASLGKKAQPAAEGEKAFKQYCAQCHAAGGNTVNPGKPISGSQKLATLATFKAYLEAPVGHMPYYKNVVKDKEVLNALYKYCQSLSKEPRKQASL